MAIRALIVAFVASLLMLRNRNPNVASRLT